MMDNKPVREVLLAGAKEGRFLQAVSSALRAARDERYDLANELVAIHNEGLVDVVAAFGNLKNNTPGGPDFFLTRHVFEQALPNLQAPIDSVLRCVVQLCREAGQDMAAGTILSGYVEFCSKDAERPREALKLIEADFDALADMLAATVAAGSKSDNQYYLAELLRLVRHQDIEVRRRAVFAVARLQWPKGTNVPDNAITALAQAVVTETDDRILGGAIKSAFTLFKQDKTLEERVVTVISTSLAKGDDFALHAASELLMFNATELPASLLQLLLAHLKRVKPENLGTLDNVDYGVAHLLALENLEQGLRFLEDLLVAYDGRLEIETLDSAVAKIRESATLMSKVTTRWFLRGDRTLCEAVHEIAGTYYGKDLHVEIDSSELSPCDHVHLLFVARKAIGYFFMSPVTAASVVISLMRHATDEETLEALGALLFDPLLMNYPGSTREYVKEQASRESEEVKKAIEKALASIEHYLEVLHSVPDLPALRVSESQREAYRRRVSESMAESMKAAEKKSILSSLFARSTLLYGNKSINYVYAGDGEPRRMETPLARHGVSMEFPRMDNIDPYGLDYMLRVFRNERFRV